MDGPGCLAQPMNGTAPMRSPADGARPRLRLEWLRGFWPLLRVARHLIAPILKLRVPRGVGIAATALVILGSLGYGLVKGEHVAPIVAWLKDVRDGAANALGFRIVAMALSGNHHVSRDEVL